MEEKLEQNEILIGKNLEILDVAKTIAKEKGISAEEVLEAMEVAIAKAGRTKYGHELDIRAQIDKESGYIGLYRYREVVKSLIEDSEIEAGAQADAPTNPVRELTGASEYVVNGIIGYDHFTGAATLSYNVFGERLFVAGRNGAPDGYEQPFHSLDFTYTWFPTDSMTLKLRLRNLLDEEISIEREGVETFVEKPGRMIALNFLWDV